MDYLRVKNWKRFQHYGKRSPPWIKLYSSLLDDCDFLELSEAERYALIAIWVLASRLENRVPASPEFLQQRLMLSSPPDVKKLVSLGFLEPYVLPTTLAERSHHASTTLPTAEERRAEQTEEKKPVASLDPASNPGYLAFQAHLQTLKPPQPENPPRTEKPGPAH